MAIIAVGVWLFFLYKPQKSPRTDNIYTEALNAMVRADKTKAVSLLRDVVKKDSDHVDAYLQLGNILRDSNPQQAVKIHQTLTCLLYTSPSPRDLSTSRMPSSA